MNDKIGQELAIGDRVVFNPPSYKGLVFATVIGFAPQKARVEYTHFSLRATSVWYSDVVKVPLK